MYRQTHLFRNEDDGEKEEKTRTRRLGENSINI